MQGGKKFKTRNKKEEYIPNLAYFFHYQKKDP